MKTITRRISHQTLRKRADALVGQFVTVSIDGEAIQLVNQKLSKTGHLVLAKFSSGRVERISVTCIVNLDPEGFTTKAQAMMRANGQTGWVEPCRCREPKYGHRDCAYCGVTSHSGGKVCGGCAESGIDGTGVIRGTERRTCAKHKKASQRGSR